MPSAWSSTREVSPEASRLLIERAHEELLAGNTDDHRLQQVRPLVRESWERSWRRHIGAEDLPPLELRGDALERAQRAHPLAAVLALIRGLLLPGDASESGVTLAVGDRDGRLLWVEGDSKLRALVAEMGFIAGTNWSEDAVGTAAPGTALRTLRSVQIHGAEHYNRHVAPWSCTASPLFDPETRDLLGFIDVTGGAQAASPQAKLLVEATARAAESELLVERLRSAVPPARPRPRRPGGTTRAMLRVLGRDRALLEVQGGETSIELSARHAEIMLMLAVHRQGLSAERLAALVYGEAAGPDTLRPELVRLRKVLTETGLVAPQSRPYRLPVPVETDAQNVLSLLDRGAHRLALLAATGPVLPESAAPGVEEFRDTVQRTLREAMLAEASLDVLLSYAETADAAEDIEVLRLCLTKLPPRSPRRAGLVARIERLEE